MPYHPRAGAPRDGFVFVENPACPGEIGEIHEDTLDHYRESGWAPVGEVDQTDSPAPADADTAPAGATPTSEED